MVGEPLEAVAHRLVRQRECGGEVVREVTPQLLGGQRRLHDQAFFRQGSAMSSRLTGMEEDREIDIESLRRRFPWVGLVSIDDTDLSGRYREIMAEARRDREIVEAIDAVRRTA